MEQEIIKEHCSADFWRSSKWLVQQKENQLAQCQLCGIEECTEEVAPYLRECPHFVLGRLIVFGLEVILRERL